jgi:flagellar basal-body rod modification protein FlgD
LSYINPITSTAGSPPATATAGNALNQLDNTQTFLQLLVAQLQNQDPDNPTDPTSFMTEIAQLTAVQSQTSLDAEEQAVAADSMIGQSVTGADLGGATVTGTVTSVLLSSSGPPELVVTDNNGNNQDMALDAVTQVGAPGASAQQNQTTPTQPT